MTTQNFIDLGLSPEDTEFVRAAAATYKTVHLDTIDNVFQIAKAVEMIRKRCYGGGEQGAYADALVQYGFTARDGKAINKSVRNALKELRDNEAEVRKWWSSVRERKKREWLSASAVHRNWKVSTTAPRAPRMTPLQKERATNVELQQQLHAANERLKTADGGNFFDLDHDSAEAIGKTIGSRWRSSPSRLETLIKTLNEELKDARKRMKEARAGRGLTHERENKSCANR